MSAISYIERSPRQVWGLDLGTTQAELVCLGRDGEAVKVRQGQRFPVTVGRGSQGWTLGAELTAALLRIPQGEPLGVCFPDEAVFCQGLSLPQADGAATQKMVQAQMGAWLASGAERVISTWGSRPDPWRATHQWVLLGAVRREVLEQVRQALPAGVMPRVMMPHALAAAQGYGRSDGATASTWATSSTAAAPSTPAAQWLVEVADGTATLTLAVAGGVLRSQQVEREAAEGATLVDGDPVTWVRALRAGASAMVAGLPRAQRPRQGLLRVMDGEVTPWLAPLGEALGAELRPWGNPADGQPTAPPGMSWGAWGIARMLLDGAGADAGGLNFASSSTPAATGAPASTAWQPRRLAKWAAACGLGLVLLVGLDGYRGWWLVRQVAQVRAAEAAWGGIEQRLAVNRYLEKNASPALPGLDAILSAAPPSLTLTSFSVAADGTLRLAGSVGNPNEMQDFFRKLEESRGLVQVEVRSIRPDQQRWVFELTARTAPGAGLMLTPVAKPSTRAQAPTPTGPPTAVTPPAAATPQTATASRPAAAAQPTADSRSVGNKPPDAPGSPGANQPVAPTSQPSAGGRP